MSKFTKTQKRAKLTRALLVDAFPACFAPAGAPKRPLAVGIYAEILAALPEIGGRRLVEALVDYTSGPTYLKSLVAGADRIGLAGEARGQVTDAQAKHAAARLSGSGVFAKAQEKLARLAADPESSTLDARAIATTQKIFERAEQRAANAAGY